MPKLLVLGAVLSGLAAAAWGGAETDPTEGAVPDDAADVHALLPGARAPAFRAINAGGEEFLLVRLHPEVLVAAACTIPEDRPRRD